MWYLIPGLGADERVFRGLRLPGLSTVLRWLPPQSPTEPLRHYAARLAEAVPVGQPCWLVGVSFGGLLALEVGRVRPLARVVLVSSLATAHQLPPLLKLARATGLYRLVPFGLLRWLPRLAQWFFGARNGREYRLLARILRDTDPHFARWATRPAATLGQHWRTRRHPRARHPRPAATGRKRVHSLPLARRWPLPRGEPRCRIEPNFNPTGRTPVS